MAIALNLYGTGKVPGSRAASIVGIPKISRYTDFFENSVFLEAKGGALLYVQKSVKHGIFATFFLKRG